MCRLLHSYCYIFFLNFLTHFKKTWFPESYVRVFSNTWISPLIWCSLEKKRIQELLGLDLNRVNNKMFFFSQGAEHAAVLYMEKKVNRKETILEFLPGY